MRKALLLLLVFHVFARPLPAAETVVQIGDTAISVPAPKGFTPVTKDMARLNQLLETFVPPDNVRFVTFIPEESLSALQAGQIPNLSRTFSLQTNKKAVTRTMTTSDFSEFKATVREQNDAIVKEAESKIPGLMEKVNQSLQGQFNTKMDMSLNGLVPLPPHAESDRSLAFSMLVNLTMMTADGQRTNLPGVVTTTYLHARGKLFFTYVYGGEKDLEWSRQVSKEWTAALLAANPSDDTTLAKESAGSGGFDWTQVFRSALVGGLIGGTFGLFGYLFKRFKRKAAE